MLSQLYLCFSDQSQAGSVQDKDVSRQNDDKEEVNPIKLCGFNPCKIAKCLSDPFADCIPNKDCDPVYYDDAGNIKRDCTGMTEIIILYLS